MKFTATQQFAITAIIWHNSKTRLIRGIVHSFCDVRIMGYSDYRRRFFELY
jgi:hypothetical protein